MSDYEICPNEWLFDERIKNELALLIYILSLNRKDRGCDVSNKHFADKFKVSEATISRQISKLERLNFISIDYEKIGSEITKRSITLASNSQVKITTLETYKRQIIHIEQKVEQ